MNRTKETIKKIAFIWLGLLIIPLWYYLQLTHASHQLLIEQLTQQSKQQLARIDLQAAQIHVKLLQNFYQLSHSPLLSDFAITRNKQPLNYLKNQWLTMAINAKYFSQISFLDPQGQEVLRVDYSADMHSPNIPPQSVLRNQSQREYFRFAQQLANGEQGYFVTQLKSTSTQSGTIDKPTLQIIYPIGSRKQRLGFLTAKLDIPKIIKDIAINQHNYSVDFIDQAGNSLLSKYQDENTTLPLSISDHFAQDAPQLWTSIRQLTDREETLLTSNGLYTFRLIQNRLFEFSNKLVLLLYLPQSEITPLFRQIDSGIRLESIVLVFMTGLFAGIIAIFWEIYLKSKHEHAFNQALIDKSLAIVLTDEDHIILRANRRFCDLLDTEISAVEGQNILKLGLVKIRYKNAELSYQDTLKKLNTISEWQGQIQINNHDNQRFCNVEIRMIEGKNEKSKYLLYSFYDISEHYHAIQALRDQTERDPMTTLWNKRKFHQTLRHFSRLKERYDDTEPPNCLAIIDIDDFKQVNDNYGHAAGDQVIIRLTTQLLSTLRDTDFVARIGGDEFAVIVQHADTSTTQELMQRICDAINAWQTYDISISIGIAEITRTPSQTFVNADQALYRSKRKGKNCVSIHGIEQLTVVQN
jgi:diguanylate cyclase (GGDEF)-like protein/PAS domain S-box-containing protein